MRGTRIATLLWQCPVEMPEIPLQFGMLGLIPNIRVLVNAHMAGTCFEIGLERGGKAIGEQRPPFAQCGEQPLRSPGEEKRKQRFRRDLETSIRFVMREDRGAGPHLAT